MPTKRPQLVNDEIYHVVMRGVDGKIIFPEETDRLHFLHDLYEFNNECAVSWEFRGLRRNNSSRTFLEEFGDEIKKKEKKPLVEILEFCLMPNHFHLLLRQIKDGGISKFMRKLGGYSTYINKKYKRQGHLYQERFRVIHIKDDNQLRCVFVYIHTNPLSLIEANWKEFGAKNPTAAIEFLKNYKWSSYLDYIGIKNYPSVINKDFLVSFFGSEEDCLNSVNDWILHKNNNISGFDSVALE
jgi:putative transposase